VAGIPRLLPAKEHRVLAERLVNLDWIESGEHLDERRFLEESSGLKAEVRNHYAHGADEFCSVKRISPLSRATPDAPAYATEPVALRVAGNVAVPAAPLVE
jgi:hypothetical protein